MNLEFGFKGASFFNIREVNSSFAVGSLKAMYVGANKNKSDLEKDIVEAALPTLYNVPIVCNYKFEENVIGGHDVTVARNNDGELRVRVLTEPCGVVPDHAQFHFEFDTDEDGVEHEYLIIDGVILWKRQDVYRHIVNDLEGHVKHSMEITIKDGEYDRDSGLFVVRSFEFTALCLLEEYNPCFMGSELEVYSARSFKEQMEQMMTELKDTFSMVTSSAEDDDTHSLNHSKEGGMTLPEKLALMEQYGFTADSLDFSVEELSFDELKEKLEAMKAEADFDAGEDAADEPAAADAEADSKDAEDDSANDQEGGKDEGVKGDPMPVPDIPGFDPNGHIDEDDEVDHIRKKDYALSGQIAEELSRAISTETVMMPWGEDSRYWYWDHDQDKMEVYCTDCTDWLLYGFSYSMNGDAVAVDFNSKKRMKLVVAPYEDGFADQYSKTLSTFAEKYTGEIALLSEFKQGVETAALNEQREEVLSRFADLSGIEAFEEIREHVSEFAVDALEEKCYAIRGKYGTTAKFALDQKQPRLPINKTEQSNEPYGGLFVKYNVAKTE